MWVEEREYEVAWQFSEALLYEKEMEMCAQSWCK